MRITPDPKYAGMPCSYVGTGCAFEDIYKKTFTPELPDGLKDDGYLTLDLANRFIRNFLKLRKKQYFKRAERVTLSKFLEKNTEKCCICV